MENDAKREPKWEPKSIQNSKKIEKKGMQKFISKIDTEKELICAFMDPEMSYKGTKGGAPGGKEGKPPKAALRHLANSI